MPNLEDIQLEASLLELIEHIDRMEAAIRQTLPEELILTISGSPNLQNRWGALLWNLRQTRSTIRAFAPKED